MKKSAKKTTAKRSAKAATKKPSTPAAKARTPKPSPAARTSGPARPAGKPSGGTYTPQAIEGIGWAPFRYPIK